MSERPESGERQTRSARHGFALVGFALLVIILGLIAQVYGM